MSTIASNPIHDPTRVFHELGDLHDAHVEHVEWLPTRREVTVTVDDVYSNFRGLPEYKDVGAGSFVFGQVKRLDIQVDPTMDHLSVYSLEVRSGKEAGLLEVRIELSPGGVLQLSCGSVASDRTFT